MCALGLVLNKLYQTQTIGNAQAKCCDRAALPCLLDRPIVEYSASVPWTMFLDRQRSINDEQ